MGDGMFTGVAGGYALFNEAGARIIDNSADGQFGTISTLINNNAFCVPLGTDRIKAKSCDRLDYDVNDFITVETNQAVSAEFGIGDQTDDGFQYWVFDPDGTYSRFILRTHANPSPGAQPGPYAVNQLRINSFSTLPIPQGIELNVRVRSLVNGVYAPFGPACKMKVDPGAANDPCATTKLIDDPTDQYFSCGVQRTWNAGEIVVAKPVAGANRYQFFYTDNNGYNRFIAYNNYISYLSWATLPLTPGVTYDVSVRVSFDNGATYCPFGDVCTVEILAAPPAASVNRDLNVESGVNFNLYPNPNRGEVLFVQLDGISEEIQKVDLTITDLFGKQVHTEQITVNGSMFNQALILNGDLAQGMYLVNLRVGDKLYVQRLIRN
jgi:hypothetical protein